MKVSLKFIVFAILGVFLVKISIADSWHDKPKTRNQVNRTISGIY